MSFRLEHHRDIFTILQALDGDLFARAKCFFGGGTAIVLALDEYRKSVDVDFLCSDKEGWRLLVQATWGKGLSGLFRPEAEFQELRELRKSRDKFQAVIGSGNSKIKFEIVLEARIDLSGTQNPDYGIPVLDPTWMYAEKLLANADRGNDKSTMSRDIIDLSMMILNWGGIPSEAWRIVEDVYGQTARAAYAKSVELIRQPEWLEHCMDQMQMDPALVEKIHALHGGPLPRLPSPFDE
jgi:hypothetical protein